MERLIHLLLLTLILVGCGGSADSDERQDQSPTEVSSDEETTNSGENSDDSSRTEPDTPQTSGGATTDTETDSETESETDADSNGDTASVPPSSKDDDETPTDSPAAWLRLNSDTTQAHWPVPSIEVQANYDSHVPADLIWQVDSANNTVEVREQGARLILINPAIGSYHITATVSNGNAQDDVEKTLTIEVLPQDLSHMTGLALTQAQQQQLDQLVLQAAIQPAQQHPRLYGRNQQWFQTLQQIEQFDHNCQIEGPTSGLGTINNMKDSWQNLLMGGVKCHNNLPTELAQHRDAKLYLNGEIKTEQAANNSRRLRLIHLLRRELYCDQYGYTCQFERADVLNFAENFLNTEFTRLRNAPRGTRAPKWAAEIGMPADYRFNKYWHMANTTEFMVLDAAPAFQFWTLVLDVFHQSPLISAADEAYLRQELEYQIDSYLKQYEHQHWSLFNGNNWTVVLNTAALHWALLNYYEQPSKAQQVLEAVLTTNWLHRDFFLADGGYLEGASYAVITSYPYVLLQQQLLMPAFEQPLHSFNWLRGPNIASWLVDSVLPDNRFVDFGDAWAKTGLSTHMALQLMYPGDLLKRPDLNPNVDACQLQRFFSHAYYDRPFYDPWQVVPMVFRDWQAEVRHCQGNAAASRVAIYPDSGLMRLDLLSDTPLSQQATDERPFYLQSRHNTLVATTTATDTPHREMDVGGIIWAAHGTRLLADMGYGRIARNYMEYDLFNTVTGKYYNHIDHMLGANTLVLPEAFYDYPVENPQRYQYRGQSYGHGGELQQRQVSGLTAVRLDASAPYREDAPGKFSRPANEGHLQQFERWMVPVNGAGYLLVDLIQAKSGQTTQAEQWFLIPADDKQGCNSGSSLHVKVELNIAQQLALTPNCNLLSRTDNSAVTAKIYAHAQNAGGFKSDTPAYWPQVAIFANSMNSDTDPVRLQLQNQVGQTEQRQLVRWQADTAVGSDVRLFFLQATAEGQMPPVQLTTEPCDQHYCARLQVAEHNLLIQVDRQNGLLTLM